MIRKSVLLLLGGASVATAGIAQQSKKPEARAIAHQLIASAMLQEGQSVLVTGSVRDAGRCKNRTLPAPRSSSPKTGSGESPNSLCVPEDQGGVLDPEPLLSVARSRDPRSLSMVKIKILTTMVPARIRTKTPTELLNASRGRMPTEAARAGMPVWGMPGYK